MCNTPRFQQRHYIMLARALADGNAHIGTMNAVIAMLRADNPKFKPDTFRAAIATRLNEENAQ